MKAIPALAALVTLLLVLIAVPSSGAAGTHHRSEAILTRALAPRKRSVHVVALEGKVASPYRPCRANRVVRFYHRVGGRSLLLTWSLDPNLHGFSRRPHRTSTQGTVGVIAKVGNPRVGAYFMTALPKTLPGGAICLEAKSGLRGPR